ncbi:phospholipase D-like domain-containing protein [Chitinophagaceae bacterium 26-R-25]|nr:phospholipase D-like domain-containing protein [Chitinophagaceae bacterium 26-R-25]
MAVFLNTEGIIAEFKNIINKAERELVIITPFIDIKDPIIKTFAKLKERNVEVLLICRENILSSEILSSLNQISNLTILQHNTVHAKCYFNEDNMIISSLNLLQHSSKNNREMGILISKEEDLFEETDAYDDAIDEVKMIVKASTIIQRSNKITKEGFNYLFLKDVKIRMEEVVKKINTLYENKIFEIAPDIYDNESIACHNYLENVDVLFDVDIFHNKDEKTEWQINRVQLKFKHPKQQLQKLNYKFKTEINQLQNGRNFRFYWNDIDGYFSIYTDKKKISSFPVPPPLIQEFKAETDYVLNYFKKFTEFKKIF